MRISDWSSDVCSSDLAELRLWSWVEGNRRWVDQASGGKVGYIYLPNTAGAGYTFFNRMFFNQIDKQALIIDERGNGDGHAANYIVEMLSRRHLSGWKDRDGLPRSAEHTSELQSLIRISSAVFSLKNKEMKN